MLQLSYIRENKEDVLKRLAIKNFKDAERIIDSILKLDDNRKLAQRQADDVKAEANGLAKQIGEMMKSGKKEEAETLKLKTTELKQHEKQFDDQLKAIEAEIQKLLVTVPNTPNLTVPKGKTPEDNEVVNEVGVIPVLHDKAVPHWELTTKFNLIDFELGVKLTGAGFPVYKGKGAKLQRALINYFLDKATSKGYNEVQVPILVNADSGYGTGQLPDKEGQMYHCQVDDLYLIPTAEVPLTNLVRDSIVDLASLPQQFVAHTPCFRAEAGSYGRDVRGMFRQHQFDKVELVWITHPEKSWDALESLRGHAEAVLTGLGLHYRVVNLCGGDLGFSAAKTYDLEVWLPGQDQFREISSCSNCLDFQSRRMQARFRNEQGKPELVHTLNGSGVAIGRCLIAVVENYQNEDGSITVPEVLQPYIKADRLQP